MSKTYKILAEKYNQIYENDADAGLERLSKEFKLFVFFKYITGFNANNRYSDRIIKDDINSILDEWYVEAEGELAADGDTLDDDMADYEADPEEVYNYMVKAANYAFENHPEKIAEIASGITVLDVTARIGEWFDSRY